MNETQAIPFDDADLARVKSYLSDFNGKMIKSIGIALLIIPVLPFISGRSSNETGIELFGGYLYALLFVLTVVSLALLFTYWWVTFEFRQDARRKLKVVLNCRVLTEPYRNDKGRRVVKTTEKLFEEIEVGNYDMSPIPLNSELEIEVAEKSKLILKIKTPHNIH